MIMNREVSENSSAEIACLVRCEETWARVLPDMCLLEETRDIRGKGVPLHNMKVWGGLK